MPHHDSDTLARIYAATDYGQGVWQMLDTAMISDDWDVAFEGAYRQRFADQPLPPALNLLHTSQRPHYDEETYRQVYSVVHDAAFEQMMAHHVTIAEDDVSYRGALQPAAAAALEAALNHDLTNES